MCKCVQIHGECKNTCSYELLIRPKIILMWQTQHSGEKYPSSTQSSPFDPSPTPRTHLRETGNNFPNGRKRERGGLMKNRIEMQRRVTFLYGRPAGTWSSTLGDTMRRSAWRLGRAPPTRRATLGLTRWPRDDGGADYEARGTCT